MTKNEQAADVIIHRIQEVLSRERAGTAAIEERAYIDGVDDLGALILINLIEARRVLNGLCNDVEEIHDDEELAYRLGKIKGLDAMITRFQDCVNYLDGIKPDFAQSAVDAALKRIESRL
jgi:hypothetical protein